MDWGSGWGGRWQNRNLEKKKSLFQEWVQIMSRCVSYGFRDFIRTVWDPWIMLPRLPKPFEQLFVYCRLKSRHMLIPSSFDSSTCEIRKPGVTSHHTTLPSLTVENQTRSLNVSPRGWGFVDCPFRPMTGVVPTWFNRSHSTVETGIFEHLPPDWVPVDKRTSVIKYNRHTVIDNFFPKVWSSVVIHPQSLILIFELISECGGHILSSFQTDFVLIPTCCGRQILSYFQTVIWVSV